MRQPVIDLMIKRWDTKLAVERPLDTRTPFAAHDPSLVDLFRSLTPHQPP